MEQIKTATSPAATACAHGGSTAAESTIKGLPSMDDQFL
jgi:hypothetical protein